MKVSKQELYEQYITNKKTMAETAKFFNIATGTAYNYLKNYGIKSREAHKGFKGKHHTEETKRKISQAEKGKIITQETRDKIAESRKLKTEGHRKKRRDGYISVYYPTHPKASKSGYVMEHRLIIEKHIGRLLNDDEVVHHINHIKSDNRLNNLQLMTFKEHAALHMRERWKKKRGEMTYQ